MKKRNLVIFSAVLLLSLLAAILGGVFERDPSFRGKSARRWAQGLKYQTISHGEAMEGFQKMGTNVIPFLLRELQREEPGWRKLRRLAWSKLPDRFQKRFPLSPPPQFSSYQVGVVNALRSIGPESTGPALEALRNGRPEVRATCAWALGGFKTNSTPIVPGLIKALSDPDATVRMHAAHSLGEFGPESAAAVPVLTTTLNDSDTGPNGQTAYVRDAAIRALGKIGPSASEAAPALKQLLQGGNNRLAIFSAIALWKIEADASVPLSVLTNHYAAWSDYEKWTVLQTFGDMGTNAISTVPMICDYLRKLPDRKSFPGSEISVESQKALKRIDPATAEAIANELHLPPLRTNRP